MDGKNKKILVVFIVLIIVLAVFAAVTQYQISELNGNNSGKTLFVKIFADKTEGLLPLSVNFSSVADYYNGDLKYQWDFGNGDTSKEKSPNVVYESEGEYVCTLKVTDEKGNTKTDSIDIAAKRDKPPVVTLSINQQNINREFNWLELLSLTPIAAYAGNQQIFLDKVEKQKGADAWGKGRLVVTAQIMDPEDDEIVSYDWKVQTADSLVTSPFLGSKELLPVKNLTGEKSVTIPELYAWMAMGHIVTLTVTDSAGNNATANIQFTVSESLKQTKIKGIKTGIKTGLPFLALLWGYRFIKTPVSTFFDGIWLDLPPALQKIILSVLRLINWDYNPPTQKADLEVSAISDINLSAFVNDTTGKVENEGSVSSSFTITNNDTENVAKNIFISLYNSSSKNKGLDDSIAKEGLIVSIKGQGGAVSNKLFYNGNYTNWDNCFNIVKLAPGDSYTLDFNVLLKEGSAFNPGTYDCKLYIYQEKSSDNAEYIDEVPFKIIL